MSTHPHPFTSFRDVLDHLDRLGLFRMDLTLGRMQSFVRAVALGRPPFAVLQVVGTNGKGSTSAFLAALSRAHSLSTGLFTSPHFLSPRERILLDGEMLPEENWTDLAGEVDALDRDLGLTYFEFLTGLSLLAFARAGARVVVYEAGLGGRFDSTTALPADLTVFTPIGLDHQSVLGDTLADIAADKAGAIRAGGLALTGLQEPAVLDVLRRRAGEAGARLVELGPGPDPLLAGLVLAMRGDFQRDNAALALAAWRLFAQERGLAVDEPACRAALAGTVVPGRMQFVPAAPGRPSVILDGAHNLPAVRALGQALRAGSIRPSALVFTLLRDKNLDDILPAVLDLAGHLDLPDSPVLVPELPGNERARPAAELARAFAAAGRRAEAVPDLAAGLARLAGASGPVLVCGSLYLLAEFFTLHPSCLARNPCPEPCRARQEPPVRSPVQPG